MSRIHDRHLGGLWRRVWRAGLALTLGTPLIGWAALTNPRAAAVVAAAVVLPALILPRPRSLLAAINMIAGLGLLLVGLGFYLTASRMALGIAPRLAVLLLLLAPVNWAMLRAPLLGRLFAAGYTALALLPALLIGRLGLTLDLLLVAVLFVGVFLALGAAWKPGRAAAWAVGWLLIGQYAILGSFYIATWPAPEDSLRPAVRMLIGYQGGDLPGHLRFAVPGCDEHTLWIGARSELGSSTLLALDPESPGVLRRIAVNGTLSDNLLAICESLDEQRPRLLAGDLRDCALLELDVHNGNLLRKTPLNGVRTGLLRRDPHNGKLFMAQDLSSAVLALDPDGALLAQVELGQQTLDIALDAERNTVWQTGEEGKLTSFGTEAPFNVGQCWDLEGLTREGFYGDATPCSERTGLQRLDRYQLLVADGSLFVSRMFTGTLTEIDLSQDVPRAVARVDLERGLRHLAYSAGPEKRLIAANFLSGRIVVLDRKLLPVASYRLGPRARWVSTDERGNAYVTSGAGVFRIKLSNTVNPEFQPTD
ncbi:MAG: hypothetical protein P9M14_03960 [Candidatus Alcyoniella australis]|nr:hypothetical protein [Candidatus Alcyoniella australis]